MTGSDIVTNGSGELTRRVHARNLGEDVVLALHRLVRLARLHDLDNQAFVRQLQQSHGTVVNYCLHAGVNLNLLFVGRVVLLGGELLKGSRSAYEAAQELGHILVSSCGGTDLTIARDITHRDLRAFAQDLKQPRKSDGSPFVCSSPKIQVRPVSSAVRFRGIDIEPMSPEQRIVRTYASAVVVMRRFFDDLRADKYAFPHRVKRIAQSLTDLSDGALPAFLGVTEARNANHDDAGRAVNTAIVSVAIARQLTSHRPTLCQIAMAAVLQDVARPRAARELSGPNYSANRVVPRLSDDAEDRLPAGTAAVLTALGRLNEATVARTVVAYETQWLRRRRGLGPLYRGLREPTLQARIIAIARHYNDLVTPEPGLDPPSPESAVAEVFTAHPDPVDRTVLRLLVHSLGFFPVGSLVRLSTGETAEVVGRRPDAPLALPRVRLLLDRQGQPIVPAVDMDLSAASGSATVTIVDIVSTEGWAKPASTVLGEPEPDDDSLQSAARTLLFGSVPRRTDARGAQALAPVISMRDSDPGPLAQAPDSHPIPLSRVEAPHADFGPHGPDSDRTIVEPSPFAVADSPVSTPEQEETPEAAGALSPPVAPPTPEPRPDPTAEGTLAHTPLAHVLVYVLDRRLSGSLVLQDSNNRVHVIYFQDGCPCQLATDPPVARLGDQLVAGGWLTPHALVQSLGAAKQRHVLFGTHLVQSGAVSREHLDRLLRAQMIHRLEWLAGLPPETSYAFFRDTNLSGVRIESDIVLCDPLDAILSTVRAWNDRARIASNLLRFRHVTVQIHPDSSLSFPSATPDERELLARVQREQVTIGQLYDEGLLERDRAGALMYALLATRMLVVPTGSETRGPDAVSPSDRRATVIPPAYVESSVLPPPNLAREPDEAPGPVSLTAPSFRSEAAHSSGGGDDASAGPVAAAAEASEGPPAPFPSSHPPRAMISSLPSISAPTARGTLGATPVPHMLVYRLDHRASGTIVLAESGGVRHRMYFDRGSPAQVQTGRSVAMIGELLVSRGEITPERLRAAIEDARLCEALLGEYLILDDVVSRSALRDALQAQIPAKIAALTNLAPSTSYEFYEGFDGLVTWAGGERFPIHPLNAILSCVRIWHDRLRIRQALHRLRGRRLLIHPQSDLRALQLTDQEASILDVIAAGGITFDQLQELGLAGVETVNSLVYSLAVTRQFDTGSRKLPMMAAAASEPPTSRADAAH